MTALPTVSFLMPIASPAPYLMEALQGVLAQTIDSWELVAVLDGADEQTEVAIRAAVPPSRLKLVVLKDRSGISAALNAGLSLVRSKFVARIDCDDVCLPTRLEVQLAAFREWPENLLVGGAARLITAAGEDLGRRSGAVGRDVRRSLLWRNQIVHSAAVFPREAVQSVGGYNGLCLLREDYELWLRLAARGPVGNVPDEVVMYRVGDHQTSIKPTTALAVAYVGASRMAAGRSLGVSRTELKLRQGLWSIAQSPSVNSKRTLLARVRSRGE